MKVPLLARFLAASLLVTVLFVNSVPVASYEVPGMRDAMQSIFKSMQTLLELSTDSAQLAAPGNQQAILDAASELEDQASLISAHVPRDEISFLAASLDRYAHWIRKSYEWRLYDDTQQFIQASVDVCIACHTRVTSRGDSPLAQDFMDSAEVAKLPARQRVRLQTATRRFDDALKGYVVLLGQAVNDADFDELARDYLVLALRVKVDSSRARDVLTGLLNKPALTGVPREHVTAWLSSLQQLSKLSLPEADLPTAALLIAQAEGGAKRSAMGELVNYIVASRLLYDYLGGIGDKSGDNQQGSIEDGARAYYLLGLTQYRIDPETWLPQSELFLEKSIRTAPASAHARNAFELLLEQMQRTYPPAKGGMPQDVRDHLEMLLEMVSPAG